MIGYGKWSGANSIGAGMTYAIPLLLVSAILGQAGPEDLTTTTAKQLQKLPGVAKVEVHGVKNPTRRVIHFLDWHHVPEDLFTIDAQHQAGKLSKEQVEAMYEQHL